MASSERNFARRIDLTSLQLFVAVCESGSIGRAAEREYLAASAISKRLSELESALGTALLYRHARGVDLTPAGQTLLHHARSVLFSLEKMQGELSEYAVGVRGHVRVHANISAIVQYLPEDLGSFARAHEAVKIELEEHLSSEIVRAVQEGATDLGICHLQDDASHDMQSLSYRQDRLVLVVPEDHPLPVDQAIDFADSLDFDHVGLHTNSSIHVAMHQASIAAGRSVRLRIRVTGLDAMCRMIENGLGVGVMPLKAFEMMRGGIGRRLRSLSLQDGWALREIRMIARDFSSLPVAARMLIEHLRAPLATSSTAPAVDPIAAPAQPAA
ncbi:MAG: LysR family transcriptional regulator [Gammaproteobacteria bacterium]|nr:LysR family transcriptional regulator [Gammaproteobacteria bacterium]MBU1443596.1 LysR family transcriptional regulator [Gammaproteobacteria bacterium]MBU2409680.1 LysR family transcriptional regulator [Gammaproteobacteria bacterium]